MIIFSFSDKVFLPCFQIVFRSVCFAACTLMNVPICSCGFVSRRSFTRFIKMFCSDEQVLNYESLEDTLLGVLPFFHIYGGVITLLAGLHRGVKIVTLPKFEPAAFLGAMQNHRVTAWAQSSNHVWEQSQASSKDHTTFGVLLACPRPNFKSSTWSRQKNHRPKTKNEILLERFSTRASFASNGRLIEQEKNMVCFS